MHQALDIVIIPEQRILDLSYQINSSFKDRRIDLNPVNAVPHLTLSMGVVADPQALIDGLKTVAEKYQGLELEVTHVFNAGFNVDSAEGIGLARSSELMSLHDDSVALMKPYLEDYYEPDIFADYQKGLGESCLGWVRRFQSECVGENFDPHITLGFGRVPGLERSKFKAAKLSLYQLGDYCTCNHLLIEFDL